MTESIFEVKHQPGEGVTLRFKEPGLLFIPEASSAHLRTARKEMLLALRSLLDKAIKPRKQRQRKEPKSRFSELKNVALVIRAAQYVPPPHHG